MMRALSMSLLLLMPLSRSAAGHPPPRKIEVAEGVYLFITPPYSDVGLDGNAVAILSRDGVLVFDANGTPTAAAHVLAEIRKLTRAPVRYLVMSHWHWDHWYGAEVYRRAFPDVEIITHETTRDLMKGPALAFNQPGLDSQIPQHIRAVEQRLAATPAGSPDLPRLRRHLADDRFFLAEKRAARHTYATLTFTDSLTIHLGQRRIQVLHYDRAVTPGDAFLYLPREKILVTGDLLVNPISFALGCYPRGWLATLERMDSLDAAVLVPGHGEPLRDKALLETNIALLRRLLRVAGEAKARALDVEQARAIAIDSVRDLKLAITHDDPELNQAFDLYLVDWFLHRAYDELDGRLTDSIAPIPTH